METGNSLQGKNILFISVKFFNYEKLIKEQMENLGASVDWFDERFSNGFLTKAMLRINKQFIFVAINNYFNKIIAQIKDKQYDYFLLLKGEATPKFFLDFLRKNNPNIKFIFYTWDSFKNSKNALEIIDLFDSKFTFDAEDAKQYKLSFRPLFFSQDYENLYQKNNQFKNDVAFIGTAHSDRYTITEEVRRQCLDNNLSLYAFYYSPSKLLFRYNKLTKKDFKLFDIQKISFKSLSHQEIIEIYRSSKAILDINHPAQKGLTMRTFEALGAGRKLITTNAEILKYPFYDKNNILLINRENIHIEKAFFEIGFKAIEPKVLHSMSLAGFVEELFSITTVNYWKLK
ncbi:glycosyltransferase family protein [Lonepinella sp. BR2904]|uniref:glycosyltransferase family protein n=1 Tax=Lonepinella sp. BR2904 TaxID=3434551 RepID=UPI003F6E1F7F